MDIPSISCSLCNGNVESSSHIFFDCYFAKEVWRLVRIWCDIPLPTFTSYGHWMSWFTSWQAPKEKSRRLSIIVVASFWWIWRFRNNVVFCPHPLRKSDMFDNICSSSIFWLFYRGRMPCSWVDWLKAPSSLFRFIPGTCLGRHQKHPGVKTGGSASVGGDFSLVSFIGKSFFIPFVVLAVKVSGRI
ncbi:RNA-directed DNA polymerase, eukaryota, reverse transcriptase zinc-binding domain protein [Tanacetum coccineum]